MAENINFIPATELPEAIGDEVSVLCLENGTLKQKPGASIGGGVCDMRIRYNFTNNTYELIDGTYQQVVSKINNDAYPTVYIIKEYSDNKHVEPAIANYYPASNTLFISSGVIFAVYPDNRIELTD